MKRLAATLAGAALALVLVAVASAAPVVGVSEDATKYAPDGGAALYETLKANGLSSNRISVFWDYTKPTEIVEKSFLDSVVPTAQNAGVQLVFALYADPRVKGGVQAIAQNPAGFCDYVGLVAKTYPSVTKIIVGNEPNQPRFWQPQFASAGTPMSGAQFEPVLARCYDTLKALNPDIDVIGVGLSPRGNDRPDAKTNVSRSPVRFIHDLAAAYRASGRQLPLMDEFAFHCYPNVNTDSVSKGYKWPNIGCINLDRLKQALWDGFNGTAQPTPAEGKLAAAFLKPLTLVIDETGWQVNVSGRPGYNGAENVPTIDEKAQAAYYAQLVSIAACDPAITAFHFLYFFDSPSLADFQSGLQRIDGSVRPSADAVKAAIERGCTTGPVFFHHTTDVLGGKGEKGLTSRGRAAVELSADEDYSYKVSFKPTRKAHRRHVQSVVRSTVVAGAGAANGGTDVPVPPGLSGGTATVTMTAWANPSRTKTFTVKL